MLLPKPLLSFPAVLALAATLAIAIPGPAKALASLNDEFDDAASLSDWTQTATGQSSTLDVDTTVPDHLAIVPLQSVWFQSSQAPFLSKLVSGDFAAEARVRARRGSSPSQPPVGPFANVGLMARDPTSATEHWLYIANGTDGAQNLAVTWSSTIDSTSIINSASAAESDADLLMCRIDSDFRVYRRPVDGEWALQSSFSRPDLPVELQVGPMAYDNSGSADLLAQIDYVRFGVPTSASECTTVTSPPSPVPSLSPLPLLALLATLGLAALRRGRRHPA